MRIILLTILALAATAATAAKAYADESAVPGFYTNGSDLLEACERKGEMDYSYCMGYLSAIADHIKLDKSHSPNVSSDQYWSYGVCQPKSGVTIGQLIKVWTKWANEHPEKLHRAGPYLVTRALAEAFPCPS